MWTLRCGTACSWRAVQLEGHCVGPKPTSLRRRKMLGGEAAAVRAVRGGKPSCAAASRVEASVTVGLCPEQSSLRRRKERGGARLRAVPFVGSGPKPTSLRRKERGASSSGSATIFGHSWALRETEKPAAQKGARG